MNSNYISERLNTIRQEIQDLRELNARYWARSEHGPVERSAYENRRLRLSQIKDELAIMMKRG
jgi:hypothetical protein